MPRFVILEHDYPQRHWDLMLEEGGHLCAWKLKENPEEVFAKRAKPLSTFVTKSSRDYGLKYLDYEGPLSKERGFVKQFDQGTFAWLEQSEEQMAINLQGTKLQGTAKFTKLANDIEQENWQLEFIRSSVIN